MSDLAKVLELLHDAEPRWTTLRAAGRDWRHNHLMSQAFESHFAALQATQSPGSMVALSGYVGDEPVPDETEEQWRLWIDRRGRKRAEFSAGGDLITVVVDGPAWWSWSPQLGAQTNGGRADSHSGYGPVEVLIDAAPLLAALRLEFLGAGVHAGHAAFMVRGVLRGDSEPAWSGVVHGLGAGADDYLLEVDAERGVLLRAEARLGTRAFRVIEMSEVEFDLELAPATFTIDLPPGQTFREIAWPKVHSRTWRGLHVPSWRKRS